MDHVFLSPQTTPEVQKLRFQLPDFTKQWKLYWAVYRSLCRIPILSTNITCCQLWQQVVFYLRERLGGIATPKSAVFLSPLTDCQMIFRYLAFFWKHPCLGFLFDARKGCVSGRAHLHSAWGVCPESIPGVNYHLGREDLGISASHARILHHQYGFDSGSDISDQILPSASTLDSGSRDWFQTFSSGWRSLKMNYVVPESLHLWVMPLNSMHSVETLKKSPDAAGPSRSLGSTDS